MKITYRTIAVLLFLQCIFSPVFATETRITQLFITNGGQEYRHTFLYDDFGYVRLETKYVQSDTDGWLRQSQTEWNRSASVVTQRERVFENNAWHDVYSIETQYNAQGLKIEESFFCYTSGVRTLIRVVRYGYLNGEISSIREYRNGIPVLINQLEQDNNVLTQWIVGTDKSLVSRTTYDAQGRPQAMLVQEEIGSVLHNTDSITWFYNDNGQLFSQRSRRWNERAGYWENTQKVNFEYDSAGNLIAETYLQWSGMHWQNIYRREFQYENNVQIRRTLQGYFHRDWRNMISIHYSDIHNGRARKMESRFDFWGGNTGELTPSYIPFYFNDELVIRRAERIRISYEPIIVIVAPTEDGVVIEWVHIEGTEYYILVIYEDAEHTQVIDYAKIYAQGNITASQKSRSGASFLSHTFTGLDSGTQFFYSLTAFSYENEELEVSVGSFTTLVPTNVPEINLPELVILVYPNPSDGRFYLSSAQHEILSWRVFSLTGQPVKSDAQRTHSTVIDLTGLPAGVYILQVQTTIGTRQQRLVKR